MGIKTNELMFGNSYYYYHQFYNTDKIPSPSLNRRKVSEVRSPSKKAIMPCFAEPEHGQVGDKNLAHGKDGFPILFVDGHSVFVRYRNLNKSGAYEDYNLDWTAKGLAGEDLK